MLAHDGIEHLLSGVAEWRMTNVVYQCQSLDQIHIQAKLSRDRAGDLRNFESMGQPVAKVVRVTVGENLGF